jgi:lactate 2-monooxygenase
MSTHRQHPDPQPAHLQLSIYEAGLKGDKPSITYDFNAWEALAYQKLPGTSWGA